MKIGALARMASANVSLGLPSISTIFSPISFDISTVMRVKNVPSSTWYITVRDTLQSRPSSICMTNSCVSGLSDEIPSSAPRSAAPFALST